MIEIMHDGTINPYFNFNLFERKNVPGPFYTIHEGY